MTTAIVAMLYYESNYAKARKQLARQDMPQMLGKSHFSQRLNRLRHLFMPLFTLLAESWK